MICFIYYLSLSTIALENNASIVKHEQNNRDGTLSSGSTDDSVNLHKPLRGGGEGSGLSL